MGLAIADAAGHPFEFMPVVDEVGTTGQNFDIAKLTWTRALNRFGLKVKRRKSGRGIRPDSLFFLALLT